MADAATQVRLDRLMQASRERAAARAEASSRGRAAAPATPAGAPAMPEAAPAMPAVTPPRPPHFNQTQIRIEIEQNLKSNQIRIEIEPPPRRVTCNPIKLNQIRAEPINQIPLQIR